MTHVRMASLLSGITITGLFVPALVGEEAPPPECLAATGSPRISDEGSPPSLLYRFATYPVNRFGDFFDLFSIQFGFGFGLHGNFHMTRLAQLGLGGQAASKLGFDGRRVGLCNDSKAEASLLAASGEYYKRQNAFGTFKDYDSAKRPWLYREHRDYWGLGAEATLFIVNAGFELHPKEAPDLLLGIFTIDYRHDDYPKPQRGNLMPALNPAAAARIKKVLICPSRVISDSCTRMATTNAVGAYYHRYAGEVAAGKFGEFVQSDDDAVVSDQFSRMAVEQKTDVYKILLEDVERALLTDYRWEVVDIDETLSSFKKYGVVKTHRGQKILRLPDYRKLAEHYKADAVLDIRIWECGVWRQTLDDKGVLKMDVQAKLIAFPANTVLFDSRVVSEKPADSGQPLLSFAAHDGQTLARELREGCDVISAKMKDQLVEEK